jgi:hypothetical protein
MSGLPAGALDALLSPEGGQAAFDKVISDSAAQTQAVLAKNDYNSKLAAKNSASDDEHRAVKEGHVLRAMREHGISRAEAEKLFDQEVAAERARRGAHAEAAAPVITEGPFSNLLDQPIDEVRAFLGTTRPELPQDYVEMWDEGLEREFLTFAANNALPAQTVQRMLDWYSEISITAPDQSREWAIEQFNARFPKVPSAVRAKLVEFWITDCLGGGSEPSE